jgi:tRNA pseudouridine38-40 synthase
MARPDRTVLKPERFLATVAYDGTDYAGWQVQKTGHSVEAEIEARLSRILKTTVDIHGSGRTDAGVHSVGQRFHFDAFWPHPAKHLMLAFNSSEPKGLLLTDLRRVPADFHCRFGAKGKRYRYEIYEGWPAPFEARYCHDTRKRTLDVAAMRRAARTLLGRHDFTAFGAMHGQGMEGENPVKDLRRLDVRRRGRRITIVTEASGYLYKMVRRLVGGLIRVGEGKLPPGRLAAYRDERVITAEIPTAPARGLFMEKVFYDPKAIRPRGQR